MFMTWYTVLHLRFVGGQLNACYNVLDRHILNNKGNKIALIHDSPMTNTVRRVTYNELFEKVSQNTNFMIKL